ncbi:MAG: TIR domain-containing protein [Candidatus Dormibacteria bacterium]
MAKVFISFDWDNDRDYRNLLSAFTANPKMDITFEDSTPGAIDTSDVGRVKAVLTTKIRDASHTLVLIGKFANTRHHDSALIGTRNWQWWEIEKSIAEGNKLLGVKLASDNDAPTPLLNAGAKWASYSVDAIATALRIP